MKVITDNAAQILHDGKPTFLGLGLPLPQGQVKNIECLCLSLAGKTLPTSCDIRAQWPDGSVRWCWCETIVATSGILAINTSEPKSEHLENALKGLSVNNLDRLSVCMSERSEFRSENCPNYLRTDPNNDLPLPTASSLANHTSPFSIPPSETHSSPSLIRLSLSALGISSSEHVDLCVSLRIAETQQDAPLSHVSIIGTTQTPLSYKTTIMGQLTYPNGSLNISLTLNSCPLTGELRTSLRIHNPKRAAHANGKWDLGDPNSCSIESFSLLWIYQGTCAGLHVRDDDWSTTEKITTDHREIFIEHQKTTNYATECGKEDIQFGYFSLAQKGSGSDHWQSPIHWDETRHSTIHARGYELHMNGILSKGLRAQPTTLLVSQGTAESKDSLHASSGAPFEGLAITLDAYWQNHPITLHGENNRITFQLFPQKTELQGGESKTWHFTALRIQTVLPLTNPLNNTLSDTLEQASVKPQVRYNPDYVNACQCFPHLHLGPSENPLNDIIFKGITGKTNFFYKRERCDVYGWRHYGELWADHEAAITHPDNEYFISHYNNQYDPLMGMTLQYLQWGELSWLALIHPLNQHIQDIDIYDTQDDKPEYNGGMFWHTDHYLPAETSSHRSYSKYHNPVYEGYTGGGGPGGQHCYTTGLALQYWLFGDQNAKNKVLQLCHWIRCFYNGNNSLLDRTFRLVTIDFKSEQLTNIGIKAPGFRYPLDRGTGNFINTLLDAYELTNNTDFLHEAGYVVRHTIHPYDDLAKRKLLDAENSWFYTVFLQALTRYLCLKESFKCIDDNYWYGRHSFMHYANWMLNHETLYLDTPEQLEFPNDTWCAQEIRKANLLCYGWYFAAEPEPEYLTRAEHYYQHIAQRLSHSPENEYTRILALLMQNDGVRQRFQARPRSSVDWIEPHYGTAPRFSIKQILLDYLKDMTQICRHFSLRREWEWLALRLPKIFRTLP